MKERKICTACGTQFPMSEAPTFCPICTDDRQYVPDSGQSWTTLNDLRSNFSVSTKQITTDLYELLMTPSFAIGQRALLVVAPHGNVLWDCIPLLDEPTVKFIRSKGGLKSIVFSHPHFYSTMNDWAAAFDCPIYIHQKDERWIVDKGSHLSLWSGDEKDLWNGIRLINIGGHFPGSSILLVPFLSPGGVILCGDTFVISPNKKHTAAMHSYPNRIPLPLNEIERIRKRMRPLQFDTIHGWADSQSILCEAKQVLESSLAKYV